MPSTHASFSPVSYEDIDVSHVNNERRSWPTANSKMEGGRQPMAGCGSAPFFISRAGMIAASDVKAHHDEIIPPPGFGVGSVYRSRRGKQINIIQV